MTMTFDPWNFEQRRQNPFKSTRDQKKAFVQGKRAVWLKDGQVDEPAVSDVAREMQAIGMFGKRTPFINVRWSVRQLVTEIQRG